MLPWYIAVQKRNPTFYKLFFLEHNLERFATNRYQHHQPFWFYLAVLLIGLMPWTVIAIRALIDSVAVSIAEWKVRHNPRRYLGHSRAGDAFPEFLVLWTLFPIVFFSFSGSKLPGYILPSIPPLTILTADYLNRNRRDGLPRWLLWAHAAVCALLVFVLVLAPQHMKYETLVPSMPWLLAAGASALFFAAIVFLIIRRWGVAQVSNATLIPVFAILIFLLGFHGKELDLNYSARPLAREIQQQAPGRPARRHRIRPPRHRLRPRLLPQPAHDPLRHRRRPRRRAHPRHPRQRHPRARPAPRRPHLQAPLPLRIPGPRSLQGLRPPLSTRTGPKPCTAALPKLGCPMLAASSLTWGTSRFNPDPHLSNDLMPQSAHKASSSRPKRSACIRRGAAEIPLSPPSAARSHSKIGDIDKKSA